MKRFVALLMAFVFIVPPSLPVMAARDPEQAKGAWVYRIGKTVQIRFLQTPCVNPLVVQHLPPESVDSFYEGVFIDRKEVIRFCYADTEDSGLLVMKENGGVAFVNKYKLKQEIAT